LVNKAEGVGYGRVCIFGDHCDWAGTQVIASSIDRKVVTKAKKTDNDRISITSLNFFHGTEDQAAFEVGEAKDLPLLSHRLSYVNAVVVALQQLGLEIGGARLEISSDLPMKKGLSSSAALCVSTARALNGLFSLGLDTRDIIETSYRAENGILGIGCGKMDQTAAAHERPLFIDFGEGLHYQIVNMRRDLHLVVVDIGGERDTRKILNTLNHYYFVKRDPLIVKTLGQDIPEIVARARSEMEGRCRPKKIGELMNENQACYDRGLRPFCPEELDKEELYEALQAVQDAGALGAKWTGAGGLGSIIAVGESREACEEIASSISRRYSTMVVSIG